jgi:hypothetical protein
MRRWVEACWVESGCGSDVLSLSLQVDVFLPRISTGDVHIMVSVRECTAKS